MGARQQMVIAARATGRMCFDTVYTDLDDMEGFRKDVEMIKTMGFDGKSIINRVRFRSATKSSRRTKNRFVGLKPLSAKSTPRRRWGLAYSP